MNCHCLSFVGKQSPRLGLTWRGFIWAMISGCKSENDALTSHALFAGNWGGSPRCETFSAKIRKVPSKLAWVSNYRNWGTSPREGGKASARLSWWVGLIPQYLLRCISELGGIYPLVLIPYQSSVAPWGVNSSHIQSSHAWEPVSSRGISHCGCREALGRKWEKHNAAEAQCCWVMPTQIWLP